MSTRVAEVHRTWAWLSGALVLTACSSSSVQEKSGEAAVAQVVEAKVTAFQSTKRVHGDDESKPPKDIPDPYRGVMSAIAFLPGPLCAGTRVGDRLVLTAGHCFLKKDEKTPFKSRVLLPRDGLNPPPPPLQQALPGTNIDGDVLVAWTRWNDKKEPVDKRMGFGEQILAIENSAERDFALLQVSEIPSFVPIVPAWVGERPRGPAGQRLTVFGFPNGELRQSSSCLWSETPAGIAPDRMRLFPPPGGVFFHQCDTREGSSGGAVFNDDTTAPGKLYLLGVHDDGQTPDLVNGRPWGWNWATPTSDPVVRRELLAARARTLP